jgi:predicted HNH restriction endonuclease
VASIEGGRAIEEPWSCGVNKHIEPGSRVFRIRHGVEPRGIVGSGETFSAPNLDRHWDQDRARRGEKALYAKVLFDTLLNAEMGDKPLPRPALRRDELANVNWGTQASGIRIKSGTDELGRLWEQHVSRVSPPSADDEDAAFEGRLSLALRRHRAREKWLRRQKIEEAKRLTGGRLRCDVPDCEFDFFVVYGEIGRDFAHVHRKKPLSDWTRPSKTKLNELAIVCANCHAMIHRGGECRPMETLLAKRR